MDPVLNLDPNLNPTYFQHSLGKLASSLTDSEKSAIRTECKKFIQKMKIFLKNLICAQKNTKSGYLITCQQVREQFHMK